MKIKVDRFDNKKVKALVYLKKKKTNPYKHTLSHMIQKLHPSVFIQIS